MRHDEPEWVVLSQHHGGTRRSWSTTQIEGDTHPAVYVALGSHANYFWGNETYPNGTTIGNVRLEIMDRTGTFDRVIPDVILIPDREQAAADPARWKGLEWLSFGGHWGEIAPAERLWRPIRSGGQGRPVGAALRLGYGPAAGCRYLVRQPAAGGGYRAGCRG